MAESSIDTGQKLADALAAMFAPDVDSDARAVAAGMFRVKYTATQPLDSNVQLAAGASTIAGNVAYTHTLDPSTATQFRISTFHITGTAGVTSAAGNLALITLVYNNGNGGSDTSIGVYNTAATALTAGTPLSVSLTAANVIVPAGSCIQIKTTKSGTLGKELPALSFGVTARLEGATG